jgi:superfamily II DNA or RNA helicase
VAVSSAPLRLRDYQLKTIKAIHEKWNAGISRPAAVLATGAGKTHVFAHLAEQFLKLNPGKRVLVLSHTDELVNQAADKIGKVAPHRSIGIVKAERNEVHAEIVSASVQSLRAKSRRDKLRNVGLIVVDECHHVSAKTYLTVLQHFGALHERVGEAPPPEWEPQCLTAGFTATLVRNDKSKLSDVWQDVAIRVSIAFLIRAGYLLDVKGKRVEVPSLDLGKVALKTAKGDYQEGDLADALVEAMAPEIVAKAYREHAADRKGIIFAPTVDSAYVFEKAFREQGFTCETVHGGLGREERRAILHRLHTGETQVVANCMVLTEGFDEPTVSCCVMARPTKSAGLYQQIVGRVLRPDLTVKPEDRGHALILDVTGVSRMHGLQSLVDLSTREDLPENLDEDLSLLEMEDLILDEEEKAVGEAPPEVWYAGPAETREFDPLGRDSERTWGLTPDGTYWLSAGTDGYMFLFDSLSGEPGTYDVVWCGKRKHRPTDDNVPAAMTEHLGLPFEMALAWAEEEAIERGGHGTKTLTSKKAKWRNEPATPGQVGKLRRVPGYGGGKIRSHHTEHVEGPGGKLIGVTGPGTTYTFEATGEPVTKGAASEIIDKHAAAQAIDPLVRFVRNGGK